MPEQLTNLLTPEGWLPLHAGQQFDAADPFQCLLPPCGMQQSGLVLQKNSVYELRFTVEAASQSADLNLAVAVHNSWQPRQTFNVGNVLLLPTAQPYVDIYVTGPEDEPSDLRFSTNSPAEVRVSGISLARVGPLAASGYYRQMANPQGVMIVENRNALPRAFFVSRITSVANYQQARARLWDPVKQFDARQEALVEGASESEAQLSEGTVEALRYAPNRASLTASCRGRCFLVLSDLYLPGWQAAIDGRPARIYPTDAVVRGIFVPAGPHQVEFLYRPRSVVFGLWSLLLTSAAVVVTLVYSPARRKPSVRQPG